MTYSPLQEAIDDWRHRLREWRHSPCLMRPVTAILLLGMSLFWMVALALKFPVVLLTFLMSWCLNRFSFVIEFLYPTPLGRWVHLRLARAMAAHRNGPGNAPAAAHLRLHSRTLEMRIRLADRLFVHPLPQFMDNLGYLVVCLPDGDDDTGGGDAEDSSAEDTGGCGVPGRQCGTETSLGIVSVRTLPPEDPIVAFVVDCGDADAVRGQIEAIARVHYGGRIVQVQSILSTHKHHDHTAGNVALKAALPTIKLVCGGAIERVPGCNYPLANGDLVPLPKHGANDMNAVGRVEVIATPGHTRGSVAYRLRAAEGVVLFTGDTLFSGGSGVPFESDGDMSSDDAVDRMSPSSFIKANSAEYAVERCFAELLVRGARNEDGSNVPLDRVLVLAGHDYTKELLGRQLLQGSESCRWRTMAPSVYFETMSQYYVALHRRTLPHSSGRLLAAPSTLRKELLINPIFRRLHRRGETVIRAILFWHRHFAKVKVPETVNETYCDLTKKREPWPDKRLSLLTRWNVDVDDIDRPVFTTMFAKELEALIQELHEGNINGKVAARKLEELPKLLDIPSIRRRPLPDTLPSDHSICKALVALVLLGSAPAAMTLKDSKGMKIPAPVVSSSDRIRISKRRLIELLDCLGILDERERGRVISILNQLWKESKSHTEAMAAFDALLAENNGQGRHKSSRNDIETTADHDIVELVALKWTIFGIPERRQSWVAQWCMPCAPEPTHIPHPIDATEMRQHSGELVRHNPFACPLCVGATGRAMVESDFESPMSPLSDTGRAALLKENASEDEELSFIELSHHGLGALMQEA